jgi:hypothetical protein
MPPAKSQPREQDRHPIDARRGPALRIAPEEAPDPDKKRNQEKPAKDLFHHPGLEGGQEQLPAERISCRIGAEVGDQAEGRSHGKHQCGERQAGAQPSGEFLFGQPVFQQGSAQGGAVCHQQAQRNDQGRKDGDDGPLPERLDGHLRFAQ